MPRVLALLLLFACMGEGIAPAPLADEAVSLDQPALGLPVTRRGGCRLARCGRGLACGV